MGPPGLHRKAAGKKPIRAQLTHIKGDDGSGPLAWLAELLTQFLVAEEQGKCSLLEFKGE